MTRTTLHERYIIKNIYTWKIIVKTTNSSTTDRLISEHKACNAVSNRKKLHIYLQYVIDNFNVLVAWIPSDLLQGLSGCYVLPYLSKQFSQKCGTVTPAGLKYVSRTKHLWHYCTTSLYHVTAPDYTCNKFSEEVVSLFLFKLPPGVKTSRRKCLFFTLVFLGYCHRSIQQVHGNGLLQNYKTLFNHLFCLGAKFLSILWWNFRNNRAYIHWILAIYSQSEHWSGLVDIP